MKRYLAHKPIVWMFVISMLYIFAAIPALIFFKAFWFHCVIALAVIIQFVRTMRYIDNFTEFKIQRQHGDRSQNEVFNSKYDYARHKYF